MKLFGLTWLSRLWSSGPTSAADAFFNHDGWIPFGNWGTSSGERVNQFSALNYSAVFAATRILCGTGGTLPLHLYRRDGRTKITRQEHSLVSVFSGMANPEMDAGTFRRLMWQWQVNWGNADALIIRNQDDGRVAQLWPLEPWKTVVERDRQTDNLRWIYTDDDGTKRVFARDRIFHLPSIITADGITGVGVIRHASESVGFGLATEKYGANFFRAGIPRVVISHDGKPLDQVQRDQFRQEWSQIYGSARGDRVATLGQGAKVQPITISAEDSQFLETRQHNVEEIARWYGVPPLMLQRMVAVTYNNAEQLPIDFVKFTLLQWFDAWEKGINEQLLSDDERDELYAKHSVDGLMRGDSSARSNYYKSMTAAGIMTRNECRALEELEPVEGGDTFLVQGATVPLDDDGKPESEFAGNATGGTVPMEGDAPPAADTQRLGKIAASVKRAMHGDLQRMLTKEGNAIVKASKTKGNFVETVDTFYGEHRTLLTGCLSPHFESLTECGVNVDGGVFVATWCDAAKGAVLDVAGTATPDKLEESVKAFVDSREWMDRPLKAVTTLGV